MDDEVVLTRIVMVYKTGDGEEMSFDLLSDLVPLCGAIINGIMYFVASHLSGGKKETIQ